MNNGNGYYSVTISDGMVSEVHTVLAASDYAAALKVRNLTGRMAQSEKDVFYIARLQSVRQKHFQPAGLQEFSFGMSA